MAETASTSSIEMEPDHPLNSDYVNRLSNKESARFLIRVLQKADEEQKVSGSTSLSRASDFTGMDSRVFSKKTLKTTIQLSDVKEVERSQIHETLISCYLRHNAVPTTTMLFNSLYGEIPSYVDIRTFRKYLAKYGFVWIKLPISFGVIERPQTTFDRYFYLKNVIQCREENREICFVEEAILNKSTGSYYQCKKYKSLKKAAERAGMVLDCTGLEKVTYAVSKSGFHGLERVNVTELKGKELDPELFKEWILNKLLPVLPPNSAVVIMSDRQRKSSKPTLYSTKTELMAWLDGNSVPYDDTMSKCDLITLVNTFTSEETWGNAIGKILSNNGHVLIQQPFTAEAISVASHVFNLIRINGSELKERGELDGIFEAISEQQFKTYDENIAILERETMDIDKRVDEVLDDLLFKAGSVRPYSSTEQGYDSEIPLSDSD